MNTRGSYYCGCNSGYTISSDGVSCQGELQKVSHFQVTYPSLPPPLPDLDECTEGVSECDQMCHNTIGSYTCSCNSSTTLNPDGLHCDGEYSIAKARPVCDNILTTHMQILTSVLWVWTTVQSCVSILMEHTTARATQVTL